MTNDLHGRLLSEEVGLWTELHPIPPGEKFPGFKGWPTWRPGPDELAAWRQRKPDLGLKTSAFPTIDVDVDDAALAARTMAMLETAGLCGLVRRRTGSEKFAVICQLAGGVLGEPFRKLALDLGDIGRIEVLADGQQVKLVGSHPDGGRYRLRGRLTANDLPELDEAKAREVLGGIAAALVPPGTPGGTPEVRGGGRRDPGQRKLCGPSGSHTGAGGGGGGGGGGAEETYLRAVLACSPPDDAAIFPDYDLDYIPMLAAIYGASGGTEWGRALAEGWATSGDWVGFQSTAEIDKRWSSFESGVALGIGDLTKKLLVALDRWAKANGPAGEIADRRAKLAGLQFERLGRGKPSLEELLEDPVGPAGPAGLAALVAPLAAPWRLAAAPDSCFALLDRLVWVGTEQGYADRRTGLVFSRRDALEAEYRRVRSDPALIVQGKTPAGKPTERQLSLWDWLVSRPDTRQVTRREYAFGLPEFFSDGGASVLNVWRPNKITLEMESLMSTDPNALPPIDPGQIAPILDVLRYVLAGSDLDSPPELPVERFLDWWAYVAWTNEKPRHHYVINSDVQGVGKSTIGHLLAETMRGGLDWGTPGAAVDLDQQMLASQFTPWAKARVAIFHEFRAIGANSRAERSDQYRGMKQMLASPPEFFTINEKFEKPYRARNVLACLLLTNDGPAVMAIERDERRLVFLDSPANAILPAALADAVYTAMRDPGAWKQGGVMWAFMAFLRWRWHEVEATRGQPGGRYDVVTGPAWRTNLKDEVEEQGLGTLATELRRALAEGRLGALATADDIRGALQFDAGDWTNRTPTPGQIAVAVREMGGARIKPQIRLPKEAGGERVRLWVLDPAKAGQMQRADHAELGGWYVSQKTGRPGLQEIPGGKNSPANKKED